MGQANNSGRNASLDENKSRAAGREDRTGQHAPGVDAIKDSASVPLPAKGKTGGAFGKDGVANRGGTESSGGGGGGGGGGESSFDHASPLIVGASKRKARKRG